MLHSTRRNAVALVLSVAAGAASAGEIGPSLADRLGGSGPLEVIVTFQGAGPARPDQLDQLRRLGVSRGVTFEVLPMAGILATPDQVRAIAALPAVRSVWHNDALRFTNQASNDISSVHAARADAALIARNGGQPFTGRGVGVFILDSGLDGTHPDLQFGPHVKQNVLGHLSLAALANNLTGDAFTVYPYVENVPHSDVLGSHGTHVSGIVGASGASSGGKYAGVAPGADLIGYGTGATISVINSIGGMDWALLNQEKYNIRVLNGSYGCVGCADTPLSPVDPSVIATKLLADRGVISVFAAGNSGPGENTIADGFKKAPWVVIAAAGTKDGKLASFSSRGKKNYARQTFEIDADGDGVFETFRTLNRPTVTAPGVDVISTRARSPDVVTPVYGGSIISDLLALLDGNLEPQYAPYYTHGSGTSMASPHTAGVVALLLEANPTLDWRRIHQILRKSSTGMPGLEDWEEGAGYINARAALAMATRLRQDFGATSKLIRRFHARILDASAGAVEQLNMVHHYDWESGASQAQPFEVAADVTTVVAEADSSTVEGLVKAELQDPAGTWHSASATDILTAGDQNHVPVRVPASVGTWHVRVTGAFVGGPEGGPGLTVGSGNNVPVAVQLITAPASNEIVNSYDALFVPYGPPVEVPFTVGADISLVTVQTQTLASTVGMTLTDPEGVRYNTAIAIGPTTLSITAAGKPGEWIARIRGVGSVSGVGVAPPPTPVPFNGWGTPEPMVVDVRQSRDAVNTIGLDDIAGHPARGFILAGVRKRLFDGLRDRTFKPDQPLTRLELANYLTLTAAVRQWLPLTGGHSFTDVVPIYRGFIEAAAARGGALKDVKHQEDGLIAGFGGGLFRPYRAVSRAQLAFSLVQALGMAQQAAALAGQPLTYNNDGVVVPVDDERWIPAAMRGHVQLALNHGFLTPEVVQKRLPGGERITVARVRPGQEVTRGDYAIAAVRAETLYAARQ